VVSMMKQRPVENDAKTKVAFKKERLSEILTSPRFVRNLRTAHRLLTHERKESAFETYCMPFADKIMNGRIAKGDGNTVVSVDRGGSGYQLLIELHSHPTGSIEPSMPDLISLHTKFVRNVRSGGHLREAGIPPIGIILTGRRLSFYQLRNVNDLSHISRWMETTMADLSEIGWRTAVLPFEITGIDRPAFRRHLAARLGQFEFEIGRISPYAGDLVSRLNKLSQTLRYYSDS